MRRRKSQSSYEYNDAPATMLMAVFCGACGLIAIESFFEDIMGLFWYRTNKVHGGKFIWDQCAWES
jgi:hypothetical protein